jgi:hypothetical protein
LLVCLHLLSRSLSVQAPRTSSKLVDTLKQKSRHGRQTIWAAVDFVVAAFHEVVLVVFAKEIQPYSRRRKKWIVGEAWLREKVGGKLTN